jgi:hypothetical protein
MTTAQPYPLPAYAGVVFEPWSDSRVRWRPEWQRRGEVSRRKIAYSDLEDLQFLGLGNWYVELTVVVSSYADLQALQGLKGVRRRPLQNLFGRSYGEVMLTDFKNPRHHVARDLWTAELAFERPATSQGEQVDATPPGPRAMFVATIAGLTATFNLNGSGAPSGTVDQLNIEFGDGAWQTVNGPWGLGSLPPISHTYAKPGEFVVNVSVRSQSSLSPDYSGVIAIAPVIASFQVSNAFEVFSFDPNTAQSPTGRLDVLNWEFGDGAILTQRGPFAIGQIPAVSHTYRDFGQFVVTLSVVMGNVLSGDESAVIVVTEFAP